MPLLPSSLQTEFKALCDSPGSNVADCAKKWADAVQTYAAPIAPPSTTVAAAGATLTSQLAAAFALPSAAASMDLAFTAFALTVGAGMAPTFVAVPPPTPVGWTQLFAPPYPASSADAAAKIASAVDAWMRSGTATPAIGGAPVPWF